MMKQQSPQQSVLHKVLSVLTRKVPGQAQHQVQAPQRPAPGDRNAWRAYWEAQGQHWRTEPEISKKRQEYLQKRRATLPDIEQNIYPFKDIKPRLNRADIEWLLATLDGQGPVDWSDERQRKRSGLDLRGADLRKVDLRLLPLASLRGGLTLDELPNSTEEQRNMAAVLLQEANLRGAHLEGANFGRAHLERARLREAQLENAHFWLAHLEQAELIMAHLRQANLWLAYLQGASLNGAHLEQANLKETHLEQAFLSGAYLERTNLSGAYLEQATLKNVVLSMEKRVGPQLADTQWGTVNLAVVKWSQVNILGDEYEARRKKCNGQKKSREIRLEEYETAVRANRQFAVALQTQGLNEEVARFAYRAQVLQKSVFWFQMTQPQMKISQRLQALGAWFFSWFLFLLAGYGYKPSRSFLAYLLVILGFSAAYFALGVTMGGSYHLAWYEALVVSMTAFHGRGFLADQFKPGDPQAFVAAFEALVGLIIEVTFIATLTRRFFGQ